MDPWSGARAQSVVTTDWSCGLGPWSNIRMTTMIKTRVTQAPFGASAACAQKSMRGYKLSQSINSKKKCVGTVHTLFLLQTCLPDLWSLSLHSELMGCPHGLQACQIHVYTATLYILPS